VKLTPPANENYAATIIAVRAVLDLPNSDRIVGVPMFGFQAITGKGIEVGELRVLFTAETQLSLEYASINNLHRHSDRNVDPDVVGYLEDTRRVKALRLRGNVSNALLMPLSSLAFTGVDISQLKAGDTFDSLNGIEICRKYQIHRPGMRGQAAKQTPKSLQRVDERQFPKHFDTANFFRNADKIGPSDYVYVSQKLHGSSIRVGNVQVKRKLSWLDKVARKLGVKVAETEYDYVYGSRNVVKDPENPFLKGEFYSTDIYSEVGKRLRGLIPKGYVVYGELVGWAGETPIQPGFTYGVPAGQAHLYVYRIVTINESGLARDLPWSQVKSFCLEAGLNHVPHIWEGVGFTEEFAQVFLDSKLAERWPAALPVDVVDEGVCVRMDGQIPLVLKAKSPTFLELETKHLDKNVADMESVA
jgi:RNA ligase-like protein